jgi:ABC-type nickel/cobalt efflux system permease component RcnA
LLPYFERVSAALVFILAAYLIYTGVRRYRHARSHAHGHEHSHNHDHQHDNSLAARLSRRGETWSLIVAGAGGGIVPCIDALSLMLLAAGLGHAGFGLVLVLFFSLGLAGTIAAIGLLLLAGKRRLMLSQAAEQKVATYAPLASGAIILILAVSLIV